MPPATGGILESSLYVADAAASAAFYERIFGFPKISDFGERGCLSRPARARSSCCSARARPTP
jgi:hypothetical protein